jgi:redox-sensing transcriptional repressor
MTTDKLPPKTIERISQYRRVILDKCHPKKEHIFSYQIANIVHNTPEQVRRDLMLIGCSSNLKKGYEIRELIASIDKILDTEESIKVAVLGMGNLGKAITNYFNLKREKLKIVAAFDVEPEKIDRVISGVRCYHKNDLNEIITRENITIGVLTLPVENAQEITDQLVKAGIKGILNYTTLPVNVPNHVYLEEYDMITSLEKIAYYVKCSLEK